MPVAGEPFVWVLAVPVFGVFLSADIVWGGLLLRDRQSKRRLRASVPQGTIPTGARLL